MSRTTIRWRPKDLNQPTDGAREATSCDLAGFEHLGAKYSTPRALPAYNLHAHQPSQPTSSSPLPSERATANLPKSFAHFLLGGQLSDSCSPSIQPSTFRPPKILPALHQRRLPPVSPPILPGLHQRQRVPKEESLCYPAEGSVLVYGPLAAVTYQYKVHLPWRIRETTKLPLFPPPQQLISYLSHLLLHPHHVLTFLL